MINGTWGQMTNQDIYWTFQLTPNGMRIQEMGPSLREGLKCKCYRNAGPDASVVGPQVGRGVTGKQKHGYVYRLPT